MTTPNHQADIQVLIADKSIIQPWRNYAVKALSEAQAFVKMGKSMAYDNH